MNRLTTMITKLIFGMSKAVSRFPLTVLSLIGAAALICYMISLHKTPPLITNKLMYTLITAAFLGITAQFAIERFQRLAKQRWLVFVVSLLFIVGYFLILWPAPEVSAEITVRTVVAVFALFCAFLWIPSFKSDADFNTVCLIHFKAFFTSGLYSAVLSAGLAAIIAAVNVLLFTVNRDSYSYMLTLIWVVFATLYYLSLLPRFNPETDMEREGLANAKHYPKFLHILVSYILIPLVSIYTLILLAYFIKILVTFKWPSGQLGPMVLIYSAAGLLIFVLASLIDNRFAVLYRKVFPKVLIPIVIMQLISVGIRLNAYAVTESRYYVTLFGIFSIVVGVILSIKPVTKNKYIALLAACFAVISIIPPVDAFTVSRTSQIQRLENYLRTAGVLAEDNTLQPKENVDENIRIETTNILQYLEGRSSLKYIAWLPEDFNPYVDMKTTLGFETTYPNTPAGPNDTFASANLDTQQPLPISGYDLSFNIFTIQYEDKQGPNGFDFTLNGTAYNLAVQRQSATEVRVSLQDQSGAELVGTGLYDFAQSVAVRGNSPREALPPDQMSLAVENNGYRLKIIFQYININYPTGSDEPPSGTTAEYSAYVLVGGPTR
ncbi:DUF4153 domain-containing protein [Dehalobacter sp. DCM]|uniref:DUF4153 domain-containing protein n=1 Tax=Dehalobacter sp. DCM TaxID=2907827 RepID=UPI003081E165|nr:DUF4153 domain-containing protein [Dehalobacter sp. DCM]